MLDTNCPWWRALGGAHREPGQIRAGGPEMQLDPQMEEEAEVSLASLSS